MDFTTENYLLAFFLTTIAGLSTGIGGLVIFRKKPLNRHVISFSLGLSAGVMIYISFVEMLSGSFDTLGEIYGARGDFYTVIAFFVGIGFAMLIDFLVPENVNPHELRGVDEVSYDPHVEEQPEKQEELIKQKNNNSLTRVGVVTAIAIVAHNMPEGLATFVGALSDPALGLSITIAIAIHNIPEGIAVAVPLYAGTGDKKKAFLVTLLSGLAEPIGALIGFLIFRPFLSEALMGIIFAAVAGIMVFISLDELLPSAEEQGDHHIVILGVIIGMAVMAVSLLIL